MLVGLSVTAGGDADIPVPVKPTDPFTVPKMFSVPEKAPTAEGVKTKIAVHDEPAVIEAAFAQVPVLVFTNCTPVTVE